MYIPPMQRAPSKGKPEFSLTPRKKPDIPKPHKPIEKNDKGLLKPKGPRNEAIKNEITWKTLAWFGWCCLCIGIGIGGYISLNS